MTKGLLYADQCRINDSISIRIPSVGEILEAEDEYYEAVSTIIATPYDMMVQLDDAGIDFTKITSFELFCLTLGNLQNKDTRLIFGDLDISKLVPAIDDESNEMVLIDAEQQFVIDRPLHDQICQTLRRILWIPKVDKKPANDESRRYMLLRARKKMQRRARVVQDKQDQSQLEGLIVSLVNTEQFSYDYQSVRDISIYQFYSSLYQISHKIKFDNTMIGYYAGTIKFEDLSLEDRTWLKS